MALSMKSVYIQSMIVLILLDASLMAVAFVPVHYQQHVMSTISISFFHTTRTAVFAKPQRLQENVEGVVYVNDKCINCAACSNFAPATFRRSATDQYHVVYQQPSTADEIDKARAAMAACPVAAIRVETLAERRHGATSDAAKQAVENSWTDQQQALVDSMSLRPSSSGTNNNKPFPRVFLGDVESVYWVGHHNERSFGATPYILQAQHNGKTVWIMVDTPKYSSSAVDTVLSLTGPDGPNYLFLTHVDDTADHDKWVERFPELKRIFHAGDLGRHNWLNDKKLEDVEILLQPPPPTSGGESKSDGWTAYTLDGELLPDSWERTEPDTWTSDVVLLHTPGHSPGSCSLYRRPLGAGSSGGDGRAGIVWTGDTYGYTTRDGGRMTAFARYGNDPRRQSEALERLLALEWSLVAPGHGHPRDYRRVPPAQRALEMEPALRELAARQR